MRTTIGNAKGGVAKSTTALYLAVGLARQGRRVLLVDADGTNASASDWSSAAQDWPRSVVVVPWTSDLVRRVQAVADDYDDVVIDTGPERLDTLRQALHVCDELVVPVTPSPSELRQLPITFEVAAEVDAISAVTARVLLVKVRTGTRSSAEARSYLEGLELPVMRAEVRLRESVPMSWGSAGFDLADYATVLAELVKVEEVSA